MDQLSTQSVEDNDAKEAPSDSFTHRGDQSYTAHSDVFGNEDNGLYEDEEQNHEKRWTLGTTASSQSFDLDAWTYVQHKEHQLHLLKKKHYGDVRTPIPATFSQRLAFFRMYFTSSFKVENCTALNIDINPFIFQTLLSTLCKTLPYAYIVMFLSSYCPNEHFFSSKMVPLFWGSKFQIIFANFAELLVSADSLVMIADYVVNGIIHQHPWNKCSYKYTIFVGYNITCLSFETFAEIVRTKNVSTYFFWFARILDNNETDFFWSAQQNYFAERRILYFTDNMNIGDLGIRFFIWCSAAYCIRFVYKEKFWELFYLFHWILNGLLASVLLFCCWSNPHVTSYHQHPNDKTPPDFRLTEYAFLSETNSGPPILHLLTSRSTEPIHPGWDSFTLAFSCWAYIIFRAFVRHKVKLYCEAEGGIVFYLNSMNSFPFFFYFPVFFYKKLLGDVWTLTFFIFKFLNEYMIFVVLFNCLNETVFCEWSHKIVRKWMIVIVTTFSGFVIFMATTTFGRSLLLIFFQFIPTITEIYVIMFFYPFGRLYDDITFHYGTMPTRLRIFNLCVLPVFYTYKTYRCVHHLYKFFALDDYVTGIQQGVFSPRFKYIIILPTIPIVGGMLYAIFKYVIKEKRHWSALLTPLPTWGAQDFIDRQMRKQFDSREYVPSQSSRYLSRYLFSKAEINPYKLDIRYEYHHDSRKNAYHDSSERKNT